MRDGNTHRVAEQCRHGEPVGEAADHRRLGRRPNDCNPWQAWLKDPRHEEDHRGEDEQRRCPPLHAVELRLTSSFVLQEFHRGRRLSTAENHVAEIEELRRHAGRYVDDQDYIPAGKLSWRKDHGSAGADVCPHAARP